MKRCKKFLLLLLVPLFLMVSCNKTLGKDYVGGLFSYENPGLHLFEIVNADHAINRQSVEDSAYELSNERDDVLQVTYLMDVPWNLSIDLGDSRKRGSLLLDYEQVVVRTFLNHRLVMRGQGYGSYEERVQQQKDKMREYLNRSYQPTSVFELIDLKYIPNNTIEVSFVAQKDLSAKFLDSLSLVPLLVVDSLPSYSNPQRSHRNVAVQSLSLASSEEIFDGSGYRLSHILNKTPISKGDEVMFSFQASLPEISWEGQWKVMFVFENHSVKTQYGVWAIPLDE
jgi:hypothetical protein